MADRVTGANLPGFPGADAARRCAYTIQRVEIMTLLAALRPATFPSRTNRKLILCCYACGQKKPEERVAFTSTEESGRRALTARTTEAVRAWMSDGSDRSRAQR